jgi:restriction endonuclease S subunit
LLLEKDGLIKGPFGGDIKKSLFVPKSNDTYKVYEQGVVLNRDINRGDYYLAKEYVEKKLKRFVVNENDILLTGAGTLGELLIVPANAPKGVINQALLRVRLNKDVVDQNYFCYYFKYYVKSIISNINGDSVIPNLPPLPIIKSTEIEIPDLPTQQKIAAVLSALDAKIELNQRINAELESMAKTLYDYWFVQFDFPNEKGKPYKSAGGKMVWNEELKREIPLGWKVGELSDIANITMGQSPPGESYNEDAEGMIFFQGCTDFGNRFPSVRQFTTQPTRFAKAGDILLSVRAPVGTINIAKEDCCIGRGLAALNSKDNTITYLLEVMRNLKQVFDRRNVNGTTFGSITKDDLFSLKVLKPEKNILDQYQKIIYPTFEKQNTLELESQTLTELRDWLLPMLMNGQVTVK